MANDNETPVEKFRRLTNPTQDIRPVETCQTCPRCGLVSQVSYSECPQCRYNFVIARKKVTK